MTLRLMAAAGSVTITDPSGKDTTHSQGDIFIIPKGLAFRWNQSDDFTKHFVIGDHAAPAAVPTEVILGLARKLGPIVALYYRSSNSYQTH